MKERISLRTAQIASGVIFLIAVVILDMVTGRPIFDIGALLLVTVMVIWSLVMTTLIHEGGHLIGGWLAGFRITALTLGPLRIEETAYGRHVTWDGSRLAEAAAARVGVAPATFERVRERALMAVLGGPVASIVSGMAALIGFIPIWLGSESWMAPYALGMFGVLSLVIGAGNGLVMEAGGFRSDGWFVHALRQQDMAGAEHVAALTLRGHQVLLRTRPRDWPPDAIETLAGSAGESERAMGLIARAERDEDNGQAEAWQSLRQAAELGEAREWPHALPIAYGAAAYGKDGDAAEAWFRAAAEQNPPKAALLIPAAAVLMAQGQDAGERLRQAIAHFEKAGTEYGAFLVERARRLQESA